uniref:Uncharacterized protein n=1 Tax=Triticum urartu TaxID=4572 RepID=A0A8R7V8D1_TRIUA
ASPGRDGYAQGPRWARSPHARPPLGSLLFFRSPGEDLVTAMLPNPRWKCSRSRAATGGRNVLLWRPRMGLSQLLLRFTGIRKGSQVLVESGRRGSWLWPWRHVWLRRHGCRCAL